MRVEKVIHAHELETYTRDGWIVLETLHMEEVQYLAYQAPRPSAAPVVGACSCPSCAVHSASYYNPSFNPTTYGTDPSVLSLQKNEIMKVIKFRVSRNEGDNT